MRWVEDVVGKRPGFLCSDFRVGRFYLVSRVSLFRFREATWDCKHRSTAKLQIASR